MHVKRPVGRMRSSLLMRCGADARLVGAGEERGAVAMSSGCCAMVGKPCTENAHVDVEAADARRVQTRTLASA
jgi:hypothetical protein